MRIYHVLGVLCLVLALHSTCMGIFGLEKIKPLIGEVSAVKVGIAENADSLAKVDAKVNGRIDKIEAQLSAQANAIVGVGNRVSQVSAGRDMTQTTTSTNDTTMLTNLNNIFKVIILALLAQMIALVKFTSVMYEKIIHRMQTEITRILESKDRKECKLDEWQQKTIDKLFSKSGG